MFVSHAHEDDDLALQLREDLRRSQLGFAVSLVLAGRTNMIRTEEELVNKFLGPRIRWARAMLVVLTPDAIASDWIRWEVEYAYEQRKQVLAVLSSRPVPEPLPDYLRAAPEVPWNAFSIYSALENSLNPISLKRD